MGTKKIICVVGATGAQGSGLVNAILDDKESEFAVRALTRDVTTEKAKALKTKGAELVTADLEDPASIIDAFEGAYGAFCVTFFWEHFSPETENTHAKTMADAAKKAGLKHVIWSTLEDSRKWIPLDDDRMPTLMGKYKVPHLDAKAEANSYFTDLDLPVTLYHTSFYWDNMIYFGMEPQKGEDGNYYLTMPMGDKKLPGIAAVDIGKCAYGVFKAGDKYIRKSIAVTGGKYTGTEMAEIMTEVMDIPVVYNSVEPDVYRSFDFPGADDLGNMFQMKRDFEAEFAGARDPEFSRSLNPELLDFKSWVEEYKDQIPIKK